MAADRNYVLSKYNLKKLEEIEDLVADWFNAHFSIWPFIFGSHSITELTKPASSTDYVEVNIPFSNHVTGFCAFTKVCLKCTLCSREVHADINKGWDSH